MWDQEVMRYLIYQKEIGRAGTPHWQVYVELRKAMKYAALKKIPGWEGGHFEKRRGTRESARHYCMKPVDGCGCEHCVQARGMTLEPYVEHGDWSAGGQGARSDLLTLVNDLRAGDDIPTLLDKHPVATFRYIKQVQTLQVLLMTPRDYAPTVTAVIGAPGLGKSYWARGELKDKEGGFYEHHYASKWWHGYKGEENILLDDYKNSVPFSEFLALIDTTPCATYVEYKNFSVPFRGRDIIITSNYGLRSWYPNEELLAVTRRIGKYVLFTEFKQYHICNSYAEYCEIAPSYYQ